MTLLSRGFLQSPSSNRTSRNPSTARGRDLDATAGEARQPSSPASRTDRPWPMSIHAELRSKPLFGSIADECRCPLSLNLGRKRTGRNPPCPDPRPQRFECPQGVRSSRSPRSVGHWERVIEKRLYPSDRRTEISAEISARINNDTLRRLSRLSQSQKAVLGLGGFHSLDALALVLLGL